MSEDWKKQRKYRLGSGPSINVAVRLPADLVKDLRHFIGEFDTTQAAVHRAALRRFMEQERAARKRTKRTAPVGGLFE
jgi:hypothetical protein